MPKGKFAVHDCAEGEKFFRCGVREAGGLKRSKASAGTQVGDRAQRSACQMGEREKEKAAP